MNYEPPDLSLLRTLANVSKEPKEQPQDSRDAIGNAAIAQSEEWLSKNKQLDKTSLYTKWVTEVQPGFRVTPNNKKYFWETRFGLHPKGKKFAQEDYLSSVYSKMDRLDDLGKKSFLQDMAREAPSEVLNDLIVDMKVLDQKSKSKTQERARLANINEFDKMSTTLIQKMFNGEMNGLNPEVSEFSHGEDLAKAWGFNRDDIFVDANGRIAITSEEGVIVPVWTLEESAITWEEEVINSHDLNPISRRKAKRALQYTRSNARNADRLATLELGKNVQNQPKEFQSSIAVDYAEISPDPMGSLKESVNKVVQANIEDGHYTSVRDLVRGYFGQWEKIGETVEMRAVDGSVYHTKGKTNV